MARRERIKHIAIILAMVSDDSKFHIHMYNFFLLFSSESYTLQQAIDAIGFGKFQVKLSILTGFAWVCDILITL